MSEIILEVEALPNNEMDVRSLASDTSSSEVVSMDELKRSIVVSVAAQFED